MAQSLSLDLDEQTVARAREAARARGRTLEGLVADVVRELGSDGGVGMPAGVGAGADRLQGMFSDRPELLDEVVEAAMAARERDPLRRSP